MDHNYINVLLVVGVVVVVDILEQDIKWHPVRTLQFWSSEVLVLCFGLEL